MVDVGHGPKLHIHVVLLQRLLQRCSGDNGSQKSVP
jgi:hypothetical protein